MTRGWSEALVISLNEAARSLWHILINPLKWLAGDDGVN
jgi:hypothetical protein